MSLENFIVGKHVVAGTGSRSLITSSKAHQAEVFNNLYYKILDITASIDLPVILMTGMAEGWDEFIPRVGLELGLPYVCCIPTRTFGKHYWGKASLTGEDRFEQFKSWLDSAAYVEFVSGSLYDSNGLHANFIRNQRMVDLAHEFVVYGSTSPGTKDCLKRIRIAGKSYHVCGEKESD